MNRAKTKTVNRIGEALEKDGPLLSIYFTAGYPDLEDTLPVLRHLQASGVDMIEIGLPFSDPLADGPDELGILLGVLVGRRRRGRREKK